MGMTTWRTSRKQQMHLISSVFSTMQDTWLLDSSTTRKCSYYLGFLISQRRDLIKKTKNHSSLLHAGVITGDNLM